MGPVTTLTCMFHEIDPFFSKMDEHLELKEYQTLY